ncbi:hypothetical protein HHL22_20575 [Hymenobacter sp. RP-2-7]|uniref:Uncharacterized protein n=1 Tax=Hymenobacter polaris TaxID=2682546 RepID=A0A7Y0FP40_9BACT|nr:hypothetical protein [Hymenobacter polaris]NML67603.1 hypothetical protein [Hymenobacter polaris]
MLLNPLAIVLLTGLTAASLLVCLAKWGVLAAWEVHRPSWAPKLCLFCLGYWLSVLLLVLGLAMWVHLFKLPTWGILAALPLGLPAAAVCRAVAGPLQ